MSDIPFHQLANVFPLMQGVAFRDLVEDVRVYGLREPIVLLDGQILDGRNRYRACQAAQVSTRFEQYSGRDPLAFVISANLHRRHLDASQRGIIAARLEKELPAGRAGPKNRRYVETQKYKDTTYRYLNIPGLPRRRLADDALQADQEAQQELAKHRPDLLAPSLPRTETAAQLLNVSVATVRAGRLVVDRGTPELVKAVVAGEASLASAKELALLPKKQQAKILAANGAEAVGIVGRNARNARLQARRTNRAAEIGSHRAVFDFYKLIDGRSVGNIRMGELKQMIAAARREAETLSSILDYYSNPDFNARIREVFKVDVLSELLGTTRQDISEVG